MDSPNLKSHLNSISIKQIKTLIRQYNLHYKIKLSQNKPDLISDLLKHFETDIIDNKMISKKNDMEVPKIEEPKPKAPRKLRIKKEDKEDILKRLMKSNKDADDKFEQEDKLIRQLIKEQDAMKKEKKEVIKPIEVKKEDNFDTISNKLQQLILITPMKYIKNGLQIMGVKGRLNTDKEGLFKQLLQYLNEKNDKIEIMKKMINGIAEAKEQAIIDNEYHRKLDEKEKAYRDAHELIPIEKLKNAIKRFVRGDRKDDKNLIYSFNYEYPVFADRDRERFDEYKEIYEYLGANLDKMNIKFSTKKILQEKLDRYNKIHSTKF